MADVLIGYSACPLTREAFEAQGHSVWTCDLLPARGTQDRHLQCDVWEALNSRRWGYALLHPMCTYLTVSAAWAFNDPDYDKYPGVGYHQKVQPGTLTGAARRAARDEALANFSALMALPFPAEVENPGTSFINKAIRPPCQIIQPHQFGDDASKGTGLWRNDAAIAAGLPLLHPTDSVAPRIVNGRPRWANQTDSGQNKLTPSDDRWLKRSETYPGIAAAIGYQRGDWLNQ